MCAFFAFFLTEQKNYEYARGRGRRALRFVETRGLIYEAAMKRHSRRYFKVLQLLQCFITFVYKNRANSYLLIQEIRFYTIKTEKYRFILFRFLLISLSALWNCEVKNFILITFSILLLSDTKEHKRHHEIFVGVFCLRFAFCPHEGASRHLAGWTLP